MVKTKAKYVTRRAPGHPLVAHYLSSSSPYVGEHRLVLWDKIGDGEHPCHWCGRSLRWNVDLCVDHLDDVRNNNVPENLVPACRGCNATRGRWPARFAAELESVGGGRDD